MKEEQHRLDKKNEKTLDKDIKNDTKEYGIIMEYNKKISKIKEKFIKVELKTKYIPNKKFHFKEWVKGEKYEDIQGKIFTSDIDEEVIEEIMILDVKDEWKILLMMGIVCF